MGTSCRIIDKVVETRSLSSHFCFSKKRDEDRVAVVGSSLAVILQLDRSDSLAVLPLAGGRGKGTRPRPVDGAGSVSWRSGQNR